MSWNIIFVQYIISNASSSYLSYLSMENLGQSLFHYFYPSGSSYLVHSFTLLTSICLSAEVTNDLCWLCFFRWCNAKCELQHVVSVWSSWCASVDWHIGGSLCVCGILMLTIKWTLVQTIWLSDCVKYSMHWWIDTIVEVNVCSTVVIGECNGLV